jgi:hypothetical protein
MSRFNREFQTGFARYFGSGIAELVGCLVIVAAGAAALYTWLLWMAPPR